VACAPTFTSREASIVPLASTVSSSSSATTLAVITWGAGGGVKNARLTP